MTTRTWAPGGWRRGLTSLMPVAVPLAMGPVFRKASRRYGPERGYQVGFALYWATCWMVAGTLAGPRRLAAVWMPVDEPLPRPHWRAWSVLATPAVGAIATQWLPNARRAGPTAVAVATGVGITNAMAEEALWRGLPLVVFPDDPFRGWLWPAAGFAAWHLVPLTARPTSVRRRTGILVGASLIGVGYGWIAQQTRSLTVVASAHALTDSSGVRPASTIWLGRPEATSRS
jgi:membrane protease YdiL (CAAX protease family)